MPRKFEGNTIVTDKEREVAYIEVMSKMAWGQIMEILPDQYTGDTEILELLRQIYHDGFVDGYHTKEDEEEMWKILNNL